MKRVWLGWLAVALVAGLVAGAPVAWGHETDQFLMPPPGEGEFADMGPYLNGMFADAIIKGVAQTNRRIKGELAASSPDEARLERLRSPRVLASMVRQELPTAMAMIEGLERDLPKASFRAQYGDKVTIYKKHFADGMHTGLHAIYDPRRVGRLWRAGTIMAYGCYFGTDKVGHFLDMGYHYYKRYHDAIDQGMTEEEAMAAAVHLGTGDPLISEKSLLGVMSSGAYSNADLASNYVGCLFYRNLTEPIMLNDERCEPTVTLDGDGLWVVAPFVQDNPQFFARYVCDHYNEALNPSLFQKGMRKKARQVVAERRPLLVNHWYADASGDPRPAAWFEEKALELATYCGRDYGHSRKFDQLVHLGNTAPDPEAGGAAAEKGAR